MRKTETARESDSLRTIAALLLGGLLALGIELVVLLVGSIAVSAGVLRVDTAPQLTVAACLLGCFIGGRLTCSKWKSRRLFAGLLTGVICFLLILLLSLIGGNIEFGTQALIELVSCVVGGSLAGATWGKKKRRRKVH